MPFGDLHASSYLEIGDCACFWKRSEKIRCVPANSILARATSPIYDKIPELPPLDDVLIAFSPCNKYLLKIDHSLEHI